MFKPQRVRELLDEHGRTRKWLAKQCGITVGTLAAYLVGARNPSMSVLLNMARAFGVDLAELDDEADHRQAV